MSEEESNVTQKQKCINFTKLAWKKYVGTVYLLFYQISWRTNQFSLLFALYFGGFPFGNTALLEPFVVYLLFVVVFWKDLHHKLRLIIRWELTREMIFWKVFFLTLILTLCGSHFVYWTYKRFSSTISAEEILFGTNEKDIWLDFNETLNGQTCSNETFAYYSPTGVIDNKLDTFDYFSDGFQDVKILIIMSWSFLSLLWGRLLYDGPASQRLARDMKGLRKTIPDIKLGIFKAILTGTEEILNELQTVIYFTKAEMDVKKYEVLPSLSHYEWDLIEDLSTDEILVLRQLFFSFNKDEDMKENCCYRNPFKQLVFCIEEIVFVLYKRGEEEVEDKGSLIVGKGSRTLKKTASKIEIFGKYTEGKIKTQGEKIKNVLQSQNETSMQDNLNEMSEMIELPEELLGEIKKEGGKKEGEGEGRESEGEGEEDEIQIEEINTDDEEETSYDDTTIGSTSQEESTTPEDTTTEESTTTLSNGESLNGIDEEDIEKEKEKIKHYKREGNKKLRYCFNFFYILFLQIVDSITISEIAFIFLSLNWWAFGAFFIIVVDFIIKFSWFLVFVRKNLYNTIRITICWELFKENIIRKYVSSVFILILIVYQCVILFVSWFGQRQRFYYKLERMYQCNLTTIYNDSVSDWDLYQAVEERFSWEMEILSLPNKKYFIEVELVGYELLFDLVLGFIAFIFAFVNTISYDGPSTYKYKKELEKYGDRVFPNLHIPYVLFFTNYSTEKMLQDIFSLMFYIEKVEEIDRLKSSTSLRHLNWRLLDNLKTDEELMLLKTFFFTFLYQDVDVHEYQRWIYRTDDFFFWNQFWKPLLVTLYNGICGLCKKNGEQNRRSSLVV